MKNFIQNGDNLTLPAPADVLSGAGVLVGAIFGVAAGDAATGDDVDLVTRGVFTLPKVAALAITAGARVYWDDTARLVTTTADDNTLIGVAAQAAANPSGTVAVRLNGSF